MIITIITLYQQIITIINSLHQQIITIITLYQQIITIRNHIAQVQLPNFEMTTNTIVKFLKL